MDSTTEPVVTQAELRRLTHENGPIVIDQCGENLAWRPLDYGTWTPFTHSPAPVEGGEWEVGRAQDGCCFIQGPFNPHDVRLYVNGDFRDATEETAYAETIAAALRPEQADRGLVDALDAALPILDQYAAFVKTVRADDLEMHPYQPAIEQAADDVRTALAKLGEQP